MIATVAQDVTQVIDTVLHGDCLAVLRTMPDNCVDAICADPPAGIAFMGKDWDTFTPDYLEKQAEREKKRKSLGPQEHNGKAKKRSSSAYGSPAHYAGSYDFSLKGRDAFIKFMTDIMSEALRVLKPGGHALIWALPRTSHWTATALEDAGFEVRDKLYHLFGSGFPKSMDLSKALDRMAGKEREVIGPKIRLGDKKPYPHNDTVWGNHPPMREPETKPATPEAQQWSGYGSALKPAVEEWVLCRKPLSEKSIAENVLKWGTGGLNIDGCRVNATGDNLGRFNKPGDNGWKNSSGGPNRAALDPVAASKRFPSHLLLSHSLFCIPIGTRKVRGTTGGTNGSYRSKFYDQLRSVTPFNYADPQGQEEIEAWQCDESCPVAELDRQSGIRKSGGGNKHPNVTSTFNASPKHGRYEGYSVGGDTGTASRYFSQFSPSVEIDVPWLYAAKASRAERNRGCEGLPERESTERHAFTGLPDLRMEHEQARRPASNSHPTVKSQSLMRWLVRLITPPGGIVLDCFLGSGSTAVAAIHEGFHFIGIEAEAEYVAIAQSRIAHAFQEAGLW